QVRRSRVTEVKAVRVEKAKGPKAEGAGAKVRKAGKAKARAGPAGTDPLRVPAGKGWDPWLTAKANSAKASSPWRKVSEMRAVPRKSSAAWPKRPAAWKKT